MNSSEVSKFFHIVFVKCIYVFLGLFSAGVQVPPVIKRAIFFKQPFGLLVVYRLVDYVRFAI